MLLELATIFTQIIPFAGVVCDVFLPVSFLSAVVRKQLGRS